MRSLELDLDVYQGPFDLLLSLVLKEEIDLLEVPLCEVILSYLEEMDAAGAVDYWDEMTEFLLLMSLLLEVKSRLLLPSPYPAEMGIDLTPEEARDQLLRRLFEYSKFRGAALWLRESALANAGAVLRPPAGVCRRRLSSLDEIAGTGNALELRRHLIQVIESRREPDTTHVAQVKVELQRQIRIVRHALARHGHFSFNSVFGGEEPQVQAVSLLALLDLLTRGEICVAQKQLFGDIVVRAVAQRESGRERQTQAS